MIDVKSRGSGYYRVFIDGVQISQHVTEREAEGRAIEEAIKLAYDDPDAKVHYDHNYEVDVTINAVDITMRVVSGGLLAKSGFTIDTTVAYDGLVIPPDSILFHEEGQATGGLSTLLQDTTKTWPADEFVGFKIRNTSNNSSSIITSNDTNTLFFDSLTPAPASVEAGHYYEIVTPVDAGDEINYTGVSDQGGTVTINAKGVPSVTGVNTAHRIGYNLTDISTGETSPDYELTITV